jgi:hypothetical protein
MHDARHARVRCVRRCSWLSPSGPALTVSTIANTLLRLCAADMVLCGCRRVPLRASIAR